MNHPSIISSTLSEGNFYFFNKILLKYLKDTTATLLISIFISKRDFLFKSKQIEKLSDEFFLLQGDLVEETFLPIDHIKNAIKFLIQKEFLIFCGKKGLPCKNYYKVNDEKIFKVLLNEQ